MSRNRHAISVSKQTLIRIIIGLFGILYGTLYHIKKIPDELNAALIFTLLLFLIEQFVETRHELSANLSRVDGDAEINEFLAEDHGLFNDLLANLHGELSRTIRVQKNGFTFASPAVAIYSYATFWELLTEAQRVRGPSRPLTLEAIHSCEMDIWQDHPLAQRLYDRQREFHKLGGKVTRILCGRGQEPTVAFRNAYRKMREANIEVRYYNIQDHVVKHSFGWDFLRVRETHQLVIWDSFATGPGGVICEAVYLDSPVYKGSDIETLWNDILAHSAPFPDH